MAKVVTELEKTILLSVLLLSKGKPQKLITQDEIVLKFPMRQRKSIRRYVKKLVEEGYLTKNPHAESYRLSIEGQKLSLNLLHQGGTFVTR